MSSNGIYEGPLNRFVRRFQDLKRESGKRTLEISEVQKALNWNYSHTQRYLEEAARRGKIRVRKVYFDGRPSREFFS